MTEGPEIVDVLVVGGGPVGLVTAYQLKRFDPNVTIHIVEKQPKPAQEAFGRAVTFWCRSMEMLDQIGLASCIIQQCCSVRTSAAYDANGNEVFGRGWSFLEEVTDTRWNFASVLRQKYVEEIFREALGDYGTTVNTPACFRGLEVDENIAPGKHRITAVIWDAAREREYKVRCRYLVGCDGSRTVVRGAAGIESEGDRTEDKWVRIDGLLKHTTMPKPHCYGALESPIYGNVLWIPLDHGATRIGFALNEERRRLYPELSQEVFVKEAKLAVAPFTIDYHRVDWASVYSVGQRVAQTFFTKGCIFLAGDACHTHSSGAGQGMNAGMHDAVNLAWKLSLVLRGMAKPELLQTYDAERRPNAQKLIEYDEDISVLVTGRLPKSWTGEPDADPHIVLGTILQEAKGFNTGLTIGYERTMLSEGDEPQTSNTDIPARAIPGYRAPDIKLLIPALLEPTWLHQLTPNHALFYVVVFAGEPALTRDSFTTFRHDMELSWLTSSVGLKQRKLAQTGGNGAVCYMESLVVPIDFLTIPIGTAANAWHILGTEPLGEVYYDADGSGHLRYDISSNHGAVLVLRPDGWIGARITMESTDLVSTLEAYFSEFLYT